MSVWPELISNQPALNNVLSLIKGNIMEALQITDAIRFGHVLAVCVGLGTSVVADLYILRRLREPVTRDTLHTLHRYHGTVWLALLAMWFTGICLIYIRTGFDVANFTPKLFAKLLTVSLLTLNALLIGSLAMPLVAAVQGRNLGELRLMQKVRLGVISGVSSASWFLALAMGVSKTLAESAATTFIVLLPVAYIGAIGAAAFVMLAGLRRTQDEAVASNDVYRRSPMMRPVPEPQPIPQAMRGFQSGTAQAVTQDGYMAAGQDETYYLNGDNQKAEIERLARIENEMNDMRKIVLFLLSPARAEKLTERLVQGLQNMEAAATANPLPFRRAQS